jgi:hypothetical protein
MLRRKSGFTFSRPLPLAAGLVLIAAAGSAAARDWTSEFPGDHQLAAEGNNYFWGPIKPGYYEIMEHTGNGHDVVQVNTVLHKTRFVDKVETRVVEERVTTDGVLTELSENYFAISRKTNNVYYFGEYSTVYKKNGKVDHTGSWVAGQQGAQYGMLMPGVPLLGARFYQEVAPDVALDRSEIIAEDVTITTPAGTFTNCLSVQDSDGLDPKAPPETKTYCPRIGIVQDERLLLTEYGYK